MNNTDLFLVYMTAGLCLAVIGFTGTTQFHRYCKALLFLLACIGLKPGLIGEEFGAVGVFLLIPFAWKFITGNLISSRYLRSTLISILLLFVWEAASRGFAGFPLSLQAAGVALIAFLASVVFFQDQRQVKVFFRLGLSVVVWQTLAALLSYIYPKSFPLSSYFELGRDWTYLANSVGGVFVGNSFEFSSTLRLIGVSNFDYLPRMTAFWGEPGIVAIYCCFLAAIHLQQNSKWSLKVQAPLIAGILVTQSFGGILVYLTVTVCGVFLVSRKSKSRERQNIRRIIVAGILVLVSQIAFAQSLSKFSSTSLSLLDRSGEAGILSLMLQIFSNPLGTQSGGGINLIQSAVNSGLPTLVLGLFIFLVGPVLAIRERGLSILFVVPLITVLFIQPPFLPLWFVLLGLFHGDLAANYSEIKDSNRGPRIPDSLLSGEVSSDEVSHRHLK